MFLLHNDFDFQDSIAAGTHDDLGVTNEDATGTGIFILNGTIVPGGGISITAPGTITLSDLSAPGYITVTSTVTDIVVSDSATITAGSDGTGESHF